MEKIDSIINPGFINQMLGLFVVMDKESKFLTANTTALKWTGFNSLDTLIDSTYCNMPCKIAEQHENFIEQDKKVMESNKPIKIMGYYCYANDDWKILFGEKYPLKNKDDQLIGVVSHFNDITSCNVLDISKLLDMAANGNIGKAKKQQVGYIIEDTYSEFALTKRQSQCLFFLLRGKTTKEISWILNLSARTIDTYIDQMKVKLNCPKKSQLIEKAMMRGYWNIIPRFILEIAK